MDIQDTRRKALKALADKAGDHRELCKLHPELNPDYIYQLLKKKRPFGEKSARNLEAKMGLPRDYFDNSSVGAMENPQIKTFADRIKRLDESNLQLVELAIEAAEARQGIRKSS